MFTKTVYLQHFRNPTAFPECLLLERMLAEGGQGYWERKDEN